MIHNVIRLMVVCACLAQSSAKISQRDLLDKDVKLQDFCSIMRDRIDPQGAMDLSVRSEGDERIVIELPGSPRPESAPEDTAVQRELARLNVPEKLVPKGKQALFMTRGEGVQIYAAEDKDGKLVWSLKAPRADLLDYKTGDKVGTHSAGPIWVDNDGGKLTGKKLDGADSPNPDAVQWLLLEVKAEGGGRYAHVTHILRLDTWGGKAPASAPAKAGDAHETRYEATYVFLGDR
jgi:preprotein translocase subunit SecD